ncbi:MAG: hypothetical protein Q4C06_05340 [Bacillota bacterium]|nr:hypothetical protein [Bacillota bacterium]
MEKDRWKGLFRPENKKMRQNILLLLFLGILLLALGRTGAKTVQTAEESPQRAEAGMEGEMEQRMAELLSAVEGAGRVDVMLTYRQTGEKTIARDLKEEADGTALRREDSVVLLERERGGTEPLVLTEAYPVAEGVVILSQGADSPAVAAALHQAAAALLDVPAHKIAVLKMK